ncbi:MAG TPA: FG-GAP-like repeat-containing protein [Candidatus Acidoferrum sp.]|nr:FG-GAP-like repeat-containing protein [Candidatus Acidoferrum sp.]
MRKVLPVIFGLSSLCAVLLAASYTARAQTFVFGTATLATGTTPVAVAQGDFNGDGVLDFVVSNSGSNTISVFLSKPNGSWAAKTDYTVTTPGQIVVGDFNLDGHLDLALATGTNLEVLLGNGDGTFQSPSPLGVAASGVVAGDFNRDGKLDLFVAGSASGLYLGNGDGTFTLAGPTLGSYSYVSAADFNQDGKLDILLSSVSKGQAYLGNGAGGFTAAGTIGAPGQAPVVADFNGDGKPDVAFEVSSCGRTGCHYNVEVYTGAGDGTFTFFSSASVGATSTQFVAADFNQDGKQDLLVVPSGLMLGNGDGTLRPAIAAPLGITPVGALAGDFNNDGQLDIAAIDKSGWLYLSVGNHGSFAATSTVSTVSAFLGPQTVFADVNGDGKLDQISYGSYPNYGVIVRLGNGDGTFQAPLITPGGSMGGSIAVGDFNNDGKLDVAVNGPNGSSQTYGVFLGNGDGTFQPAISGYSNTYALSMATADVNGDGKLDLLATVQNQALGLNVYLGNGDGTFRTGTNYPACFSTAIVVADFNGDGTPDVGIPCGASLNVLIGNGDGTFQPVVSYGTGGGSVIASGDFNGDGKVDVAVGTFIFLGNGDGTFQALPSIASIDPIAMTAGDFNGDGKTDLAMVIYPYSANLIRLFYGNADGTFTDSFLLGGPLTGMAAGDLNGDGAIDLFADTPAASTPTYTNLNVPVASLSPGQLAFPNVAVGSTGSPLTLTVFNSGIASLTLGAPTITGDFAVSSNTCPGTLAFSASCALQVSFTPTAMGLRTGLLAIATDSFGGTANLALSGNGAVSGAAVQVSTSSLTFAGQLVGTSSPSQIVIVTSSGAGAVTFSKFSTSGDFTQTNNCPATLNPSASCTVFVTFTPTATGTRSGSLVISDNAPGGSQTVSLTGTGTAPAVALSPTSLTFATQLIGTISHAKTVTLTNTGTAALTVNSLTFSGANPSSFSQTNGCGSSVAAGAKCSISVSFKPSTINTLTATLNVNDNAAGSPQTVSLSGTGTEVKLSLASINFGSVTVGTKSAVKTVTLTNVSENTVSVTSISLTGTNASDFSETNTCGSSVQGGKSCTVSLTFTPSAKGTRTASLSVADNGGGSPQTVSLSGTGK